jgi:hypothetical protein
MAWLATESESKAVPHQRHPHKGCANHIFVFQLKCRGHLLEVARAFFGVIACKLGVIALEIMTSVD